MLGGALVAGAVLLPSAAHAQTTFLFRAGYDPTNGQSGLIPVLSGDGTFPASTVAYKAFDGSPSTETGTTSDSGASTSSSLYTSGTGQNFTENSTAGTGPHRITQAAFTIPKLSATNQVETVKLSTVSFFGYQKGSTSTLSPFTAGHLAIYNNDPNNGGVPFFGNYTTDVLISSTFTGGYRIPSGGSPMDTTRPIYKLTLDASSAPVLGAGNYFFGVSFNVNNTGSNPNDGFTVFAQTNDATTGQPKGTNGDATIYDQALNGGAGGFKTDQPGGLGVLDAFPFLATGNVVGATPEPSALALLGTMAVPGIAALAYRRRRSRRVAA